MKRVMSAAALLLCSLSVFAQPADEIQSWSAPPYWSPPAVSPESADQGARTALSSGRQALAASPVPLPFVAITPCRQYDSRSASFLADNTPRTVTLIGAPCAIPSDAQAVAANVTVFNIIGAGSNGVLKVGIAAPPVTSWINYPFTETQRANAGVLPLGAGGTIVVQVNQGAGSVDFVVDVFGYYSPLGIVNHVNGLTGDLAISAGTNVSLTQAGNTLTIAATPGSGGPPTGPAGGALTGTYPNPGLAGSFASLGANTFAGTQTIIGGNLALPATTGSTVGVLTLGGQPFLHAYGGAWNTFVGVQAGGAFSTTGDSNSAFGYASLRYNTTGYRNAAFGYASLVSNTTGYYNSAFGYTSLVSNTTGYWNAAFGYASLYSNTTGFYNAAFGAYSLQSNTTGLFNAAFGAYSLQSNTTGSSNAAFGLQSLVSNTTGGANAAFGASSLQDNTTGAYNAAFGHASLLYNTTGYTNAAFGASSLQDNTTGAYNAAFGPQSLYSNTTGLFNIAIGYSAGSNLTTGDNNIDIGNGGSAAEANTIRIGVTGTQTRAFIAGIRGVTTALTAIPVLIDSNGQLGTVSSSRRFKDDIADMDAASSALMMLRPVTFHYKTDQNPSGRTLQYGLIAEEVAEVYPGLVARSADGQIETVLYQFLPSMLLNEYQKQQRTIEANATALQAQIEVQRAEIESLKATMMELGARLARAEARFSDAR